VNNAPYYHSRAAELRALAGQMKDDDCRELLRQIAAAFECLAARLEDRDRGSREAAD
jgi:hypothetical protein